jgi:hypothetical protein
VSLLTLPTDTITRLGAGSGAAGALPRSSSSPTHAVALDPGDSSISPGTASTTTHAPAVNLLATNTTAAMAVRTAPTPLRTARGNQRGERRRYQ